MSAPHLPVPPLETTLARLRESAEVLAGPGCDRLAERIDAFARGTGPRLHAALLDYASAENAAGRSWLTAEWLAGYFRARDPLPLTSSVGFALDLDPRTGAAPGDDMSWVADRLHRIATVHLDEVRDETPPLTDARGTALDMSQHAILAGGLRHPQPGEDCFRPPARSRAHREIGVFVRGRLFALTVGDEAGRPLSANRLAAGLAGILTAVHQTPGDTAHVDAGGVAGDTAGFGGMSYLGSGDLAPILASLLSDPGNARTYDRLRDFLSTVTLTGLGHDATEVGAVLTEPGRAWAYTPIGYQLDVAARTDGAHVEHSMFDGSVMADTVARIQSAQSTEATPHQGPLDPPEELCWALTPEQADTVHGLLAAYRVRASCLRNTRLVLPRVPDSELPFRVSADALHQLALTVAQVLTYGRGRSVYESVDMRAYSGGRTECLRPLTGPALAFARALIAGRADAAGLTAVLDAHLGWVKACKQGAGFDRHLFGLEFTARRTGTEEPLFADPALAALRTDFLSTSSLGAPDRVVRYTFAPTSADGLGICYVPHPDALGFVVSHVEGAADNPEGFVENLDLAAGMLHTFLSAPAA